MQSTLSALHLTGVHFLLHMLQIDEQSLFRCHIYAKPTTYIIAYKNPPMTIWQFQFINEKCMQYIKITWTTKGSEGQIGNTESGTTGTVRRYNYLF